MTWSRKQDPERFRAVGYKKPGERKCCGRCDNSTMHSNGKANPAQIYCYVISDRVHKMGWCQRYSERLIAKPLGAEYNGPMQQGENTHSPGPVQLGYGFKTIRPQMLARIK